MSFRGVALAVLLSFGAIYSLSGLITTPKPDLKATDSMDRSSSLYVRGDIENHNQKTKTNPSEPYRTYRAQTLKNFTY